MGDSADMSDSAASSDERPSPPASSGGDSTRSPGSDTDAELRVDFYVLDQSSAAGRMKLACKLAEKAYLAAQTALVWHTDADELKTFDDMLWTFVEGSFVPHDVLVPGAGDEAPVLLSAGTVPSGKFDIIINLAPDVPACLSQTRRVVEIIDGDESRRRAGRARFKAYRDMGVQPASHNIRGD